MGYAEFIKRALSIAAAGAVVLSAGGCALQKGSGTDNTTIAAKELTAGLENGKEEIVYCYDISETDYEKFLSDAADFSLELFKNSMDSHDSTLLSPVSVMLALGMTANGAAGETLVQMEQTLSGGIGIEDLNVYCRILLDTLADDADYEKCSFSIADSVWIKNSISENVKEEFLKAAASYYDAQIYGADFDGSTLNDVNNWVSENTDGMIDSILEEIKADDIIYLINAVAFDAEWENVYDKNSVSDGKFTNIDNETVTAEMMYSDENKYISGDNVTGFIKPYMGNYSFVALLPDENVSLEEYAARLDGKTFRNLINNAIDATVHTATPKFNSGFSAELSDILQKMGMKDAFSDTADFTNMGDWDNPVYIDRIIHKTFIAVDENGTKAGASTVVAITEESAPEPQQKTYTVTLDRPFMYAIVDDTTGMPVFIGTLTDIQI